MRPLRVYHFGCFGFEKTGAYQSIFFSDVTAASFQNRSAFWTATHGRTGYANVRYYESDYYNKGYRPVAIVNIIGIFIIIGELIIFGIRENPF